jgi:hypothetical protein
LVKKPGLTHLGKSCPIEPLREISSEKESIAKDTFDLDLRDGESFASVGEVKECFRAEK